MNQRTMTDASARALTTEQLGLLNAAAVAMLDPMSVQASSPPGQAVQLAGLQEKLRACAALAGQLNLPGFAELAGRIAAQADGMVDAARVSSFERWIDQAIAFCSGQLEAAQIDPLVDQTDAIDVNGSLARNRGQILSLLVTESALLRSAREQSVPPAAAASGPEIGSDEMAMLARSCADLASEAARFEHAAPHQLYSLVAERIGYLVNAMRYMGLDPLADLFNLLVERLQAQVESGAILDDEHQQALLDWPQRWANWFSRRRPEQLSHAIALHELALWRDPALQTKALASVMSLQLVGSRRIAQAADDSAHEDLSLELPADSEQDIVDSLVSELQTLTVEFIDAVTEVATGNSAQLGSARRIAHTIKGAANTVGVPGVANLTHALEDLLQLLEQAGGAPEKRVVDILCEASDCLSEMVDSLSGTSPAPENALSIYRQVLAEVNRFAEELEARFQARLAELPAAVVPATPAEAEKAVESATDDAEFAGNGNSETESGSESGSESPALGFEVDQPDDSPDTADNAESSDGALSTMSLADFNLPELDLTMDSPTVSDDVDFLFDVPVLGGGSDTAANWIGWDSGRHDRSSRLRRPEPEVADDHTEDSELVTDGGQQTPSLRVPAQVMERLLQSADEAVVAVSELQDIIADVAGSHRSMRDGSDRLDALSVELDRLIDAEPMHGAPVAGGAELDPLELERFTEIHTVSRRITEVAADGKLIEQQIEQQIDRANGLVDRLERVQAMVRDGALRARMVEAGSIASRLQRAARQAARACDKQVQLTVLGGDTAVDGETLQRIVDSLAHLVRNAVDHGIESSLRRRQAGKPAQGEIRVTFEREVSAVSIVVDDDGGGLDLPGIERRARSLGLIADDTELDANAAAELILAPGFTTRAVPTQLSGRGIGLDVVNQTVRGMRGLIAVRAGPQGGTRFELTLPLQLTSLSAFVMRSETHVLALSVRGIEKILANTESIEYIEEGMRLAWAGRQLTVRRLDEVLGLPPGMFGGEPGKHAPGDVVLIVRLPGGEPVAVLVPEPGQAREVVVRSLPEYLPRIPGADGVAVLGDGAVAPVIDLPEMLAATTGARPDPRRLGRVVQPMPVCMVVDDSVSVRRSMAHFMLDLGLYCDAAADGLQALQMVTKRVPDLVVLDLEMPRMNGVELTQALRSEPATRGVPIIMITSRHSEKHRAMAMAAGVSVFMTKPYTEDELASVVGSCLAG